jgi:hypothetical protein
VIKNHLAIKLRLGKVNENAAVIHVLKEGMKTPKFEVEKK